MHLSKLAVQNFRGFSNVTIEFDDITVLIGENNTGKTSVLHAIQIALARGISRKGTPFEDQDFLLTSPTAKPGDAGALVITLEFSERKPGDWDAAILQTLADVLDLRTSANGDLNYVTLRITSSFDNTIKDFVTDFDFLNAKGAPIPKGKRPATLISAQQLNPIFYLSALRDTAREFGQRSSLWSPFLRNPAIPPQDQQRLEQALQALNDEIIRLDTRLTQVKATLGKAQDVVSLGQQNVVMGRHCANQSVLRSCHRICPVVHAGWMHASSMGPKSF
jgi:putative ATP-dependent endonuclease of OLD family